jgi:hypothetical protein
MQIRAGMMGWKNVIYVIVQPNFDSNRLHRKEDIKLMLLGKEISCILTDGQVSLRDCSVTRSRAGSSKRTKK